MKKESRITITNYLSPEDKGVKFELDHPDPPELLEDEYYKVNDLVSACGQFWSSIGEFGEATQRKHVVADLKKLRKYVKKFEEGCWLKLRASIDNLESGLSKL